MLEERIHNYREAAASAKEAGEAAKARRCERGLKVSRVVCEADWESRAVGKVAVKGRPLTGVINMVGPWPVFQQGPGSYLHS